MNEKLARVSWEMGQALLPEHLVALEESILADIILRFRLLGLPWYGVGELKFNGSLLSEGVLSIEAMTLVTANGLLINVPGNAGASQVNLNLTGMTTVSVYLHVLRRGVAETDATNGWGGKEGDGVKRTRYRLELTAEQEYPEALDTVKLAEMKKSPEGFWTLSSGYIPPLLQVGASPFLTEEMTALSEALELFRYNLTMDSSSYVSGDSLFSVKQCLKSVFRAQRMLENYKTGITLHPFYLYDEVQTLYADVCFYRNTTPQNITQPYRHDQPVLLKEAVERLKNQMHLVRSRPPYVTFTLQDNLYEVGLPDEVRQATDVYFLVQRAQLTDTLSLDNLKLAGVTRLPFVHKMALHGIPLKKVERPPFQHTFGSEVEFYQIKESEEWDHALNEMSVAFFSRPDLAEADFYVYWRMGQ
ncbi:type VI secretion system baseplate subunit TssK [Desulfoluna sp.]|uniref:type VI secretion system baseplate subunit TssK n=1 Tax=Desulfoluna sp. TaxID=2045199 RepID=UPI002639001A|nr:type VI secretion system baseplate subunit TssK [Desulfoluna sp.]